MATFEKLLKTEEVKVSKMVVKKEIKLYYISEFTHEFYDKLTRIIDSENQWRTGLGAGTGLNWFSNYIYFILELAYLFSLKDYATTKNEEVRKRLELIKEESDSDRGNLKNH